MSTTIETPKQTIPAKLIAGCRMVGIGGLTVVKPPERLKTVLGSCVGIVLYEGRSHIAGLAHSILPEGDEPGAEPGKYADQAVDTLLLKVLAAGARKEMLVAKLAGGATMFGSSTSNGLGERNVQSATRRLAHHGIPIVGKALGGCKGRRLVLDPETGCVEVEVIGESKTTI